MEKVIEHKKMYKKEIMDDFNIRSRQCNYPIGCSRCKRHLADTASFGTDTGHL